MEVIKSVLSGAFGVVGCLVYGVFYLFILGASIWLALVVFGFVVGMFS